MNWDLLIYFPGLCLIHSADYICVGSKLGLIHFPLTFFPTFFAFDIREERVVE